MIDAESGIPFIFPGSRTNGFNGSMQRLDTWNIGNVNARHVNNGFGHSILDKIIAIGVFAKPQSIQSFRSIHLVDGK
jgi:hypothetical protein